MPVANKTTLRWNRVEDKLPLGYEVCLCRGESYDSNIHNDYLLAYRATDDQGELAWVTGRHGSNVTVTEWARLP